MKFDVIVGNPPYQDSSHNIKVVSLWTKILKLSFNIINLDGIVSLVIPSSFTTNRKMFADFFANKNPLIININNINNYFPTVNIPIGYFITQNSKALTNCNIITNLDNFYINQITNYIPISKHHELIIDKLISYSYIDNYVDWTYADSKFTNNRDQLSRVETDLHNIKVLSKTLKGIDQYYYGYKTINKQNGMRVIINNWQGKFAQMRVSDSIITNGAYTHFPVNSLIEGNNLKALLQTSVYKFLILTRSNSSCFTVNSFSKLPKLDLNRQWTDQELYLQFGLSLSDIQYVEQYTKGKLLK